MTKQIWTVGHSNRTSDELIELLRVEAIELLADVRRFPGSRLHPQFNRDALRSALAEQRIAYRHFESLGGRRRRKKGPSPNRAWRVESFNAYADHMASSEFQQGLVQLEQHAEQKRTAIMCSEALPWRCHRRLIADALIARGWEVFDIFSPTQTKPHHLTEFARVENGSVTYPEATLFD